MTVTTTHTFKKVSATTTVNATTAAAQTDPIVTSGPNGGSTVFYLDTGPGIDKYQIIARTLDAKGVPVGPEKLIGATRVQADVGVAYDAVALKGGGYAVVWYDDFKPKNIRCTVLDANMNVVTAEFLADNDSISALNMSVAALQNGGFVIAWEQVTGNNNRDIVFQRYSATGTPVGDQVKVETGTFLDGKPSVVGLADGGFAMAWERFDVADGSTSAMSAVYNANGTVRKAATMFDTNGSINGQVDAVALPDGGYAVSYVDNGWGAGTTEVTTAYFAADGTHQGYVRSSQDAANNSNPHGAVSVDGNVAVVSSIGGMGSSLALSVGAGAPLIKGQSNAQLGQGMLHSDIRWTDASHVMVLSEVTGVGADASSSGIVSEIYQVTRTIVGDGAADAVSYKDGIHTYATAGGGNDTVVLGYGNDQLLGGAGNDWLSAGAGNDSLFGQEDNDTLLGGAGEDWMEGGIGDDQLFGGDGLDVLLGGDGADWMEGGSQADQLYGGEGKNVLQGQAGNDWMIGGSGYDQLYGGADADVMQGMGGADWIDGGAGNNQAYGGEGNDTIQSTSGDDWAYGGTGNDQIYGGSGKNVLFGEDGDEWMVGGSDYDQVYGGEGQNVLFGEGGGDWMTGGSSYDQLYGGSGNDTLLAGSGGDWIVGGQGADAIFGQAGGDTFVANAGELQGDVYADFEAGSDILVLQGYGAGAKLTSNGAGTYTLSYGGGVETFSVTASRELIPGLDYVLA